MAVQWLRLHASNAGMQGTQFRSLVRELRSHMLWGAAKINKFEKLKITHLLFQNYISSKYSIKSIPRSSRELSSHGFIWLTPGCDTQLFPLRITLRVENVIHVSEVVQSVNNITMFSLERPREEISFWPFSSKEQARFSRRISLFSSCGYYESTDPGPFSNCCHTARSQMCGPAAANVRINVVCF